jgi:hypothetical protein
MPAGELVEAGLDALGVIFHRDDLSPYDCA